MSEFSYVVNFFKINYLQSWEASAFEMLKQFENMCGFDRQPKFQVSLKDVTSLQCAFKCF